MLPVHPAKRYPYLSQYIHHARSRGFAAVTRLGSPFGWSLGLAIFGLVGLMSGGFGTGAVMIFLCGLSIPVGVAGVAVSIARPRPPSPEERQRMLAAEVAHCIGRLMELHRLHRDLDPSSVTLLEEAARIWDEGRRSGVDHDAAMRDLCLLYAPLLPRTPQPRGALEWVSEGVEALSRTADPRPPPPFFNEARRLVEEMRDSGHESARAWEELSSETTLPPGDPLRERLRGR